MRVGVVEAADTRELRRRVLRPSRGAADPLPGDDLPEAVHIAAVEDDGTVVGTCFLHPEPCTFRPNGQDAWRLRQMATDTARQGQGIGALVLDGVAAYLRSRGVALVWCHARERAVPFYRRNGFEVCGDVFLEYPEPDEPIPHFRMWRDLGEPFEARTSS